MRFSLYFSVAKAHGQRRKVDGTRKDKNVDGKTKTQKRRRLNEKQKEKKSFWQFLKRGNDASLEKEEEEEESQEEKKCVFVGSAE